MLDLLSSCSLSQYIHIPQFTLDHRYSLHEKINSRYSLKRTVFEGQSRDVLSWSDVVNRFLIRRE